MSKVTSKAHRLLNQELEAILKDLPTRGFDYHRDLGHRDAIEITKFAVKAYNDMVDRIENEENSFYYNDYTANVNFRGAHGPSAVYGLMKAKLEEIWKKASIRTKQSIIKKICS